ncbi:MAG TPA: hypothetical protein VF345_02595 [Chthoniobacterales bacterium]
MSEPEFLHRFIPAPAGSTARSLLLLHGTGGDENDMIPLGRDLDPTAVLLSSFNYFIGGNACYLAGLPAVAWVAAESAFAKATADAPAFALRCAPSEGWSG